MEFFSSMTPSTWPVFSPGTEVQIVKLGPDGTEVTRYPGVVVDGEFPVPWLVLCATWVSRAYDLDGLLFVPGDRLHEFFSPTHPFNVFSVFSPEGTLRGWYANVTYPSRLDHTTDPPTLYWHDLYLDVIFLPNGEPIVRDEDELADSDLLITNPALHAAIVATRDELLRLCRTHEFPFHER
jgi:hypothetical protein